MAEKIDNDYDYDNDPVAQGVRQVRGRASCGGQSKGV